MPGEKRHGRKKHSDWDEVTCTEVNIQVECNYCKTRFSKKVERARYHMKVCKDRSKMFCEQNSEQKKSTDEVLDTLPPEIRDIVENEDKDGPASKKQKLMDNYAISTPKSLKDTLDLKVAKFFFSANISFNTAENTEFKYLICSLRPGYEPPNRKLIANELLEKVHEEVTHSINSAMKQTSKVLTVMQDGWSSCSNDPILAHSVHDGENSTLISVVDCKALKILQNTA